MLGGIQVGEFRGKLSQYVQLIFKLFSKKKFLHILYNFIYTYTWTERGKMRERKGG